MSHAYTCGNCGGEFFSDHEKEDALDECCDTFGFVPPELDQVEVCDVCWREMVAADKKGMVISGYVAPYEHGAGSALSGKGEGVRDAPLGMTLGPDSQPAQEPEEPK